MRRVPEVLDCWFESGSMPFAQVHYPFENADWFESHYPGDFIVEYIGQSRGWFYTLHVLATALFDRPAFRSCVSHGIVLGDDGLKMSKSLRNYPDPMEVFDQHGADAMRWYLLSSPILRGNDFSVTAAGLRDTARVVLLPLWNVWSFLSMYANAEGVQGTVRDGVERPFSTNVLDRYVVAKTRDLVEDVTRSMDAYDLFGACNTVRAFVETLTNWYVRRSRDRFWNGDLDAIDTLHTVLEVFVRVVAPLLPYVADEIYGGLHASDAKGAASVHLTDWPRVEDLPGDEELVHTMDEVRDVCSATLSVRKANQRRVRQPLSHLVVASPDAHALAPFVDIIADEVNVKEVELTDDVDSVATKRLQVIPSAIGPRLGSDTQHVIRAVRDGEWTQDGDAVVAGGHRLEPGEFVLALQTEDAADTGRASTALGSGVGVVVLNVDVTEELEIEGQARDLIRMVQQARRDKDLAVTDRIHVRVKADQRWATVVRVHEELIATETLAVGLDIDDSGTDAPEITVEIAEA
jgi:isoleucyl-tRNA synthetase